MPPYKGSMLRGGFGHAFKRVVCAIKSKECSDCLLHQKCIYSYVFETPPPVGTKIMTKYRSAPHPFVIEPPHDTRREYHEGDEFSFRLILIGKAIDYLPYFVYAFDELGRIGIGKGKAGFTLLDVRTDGEITYESASKTLKPVGATRLSIDNALLMHGDPGSLSDEEVSSLTLSFVTPTRILYDHHLTLDLEFHIFFRNLLRRLALIAYFHCGEDTSSWNFKELIKRAEGVTVMKRALSWYDWERYSGRQDTRMKLGGFVGEITFEGDMRPFLQIIEAGEVLHVGKGTAFGLGKYAIKDSERG